MFLDRLGAVAAAAGTSLYAWALLSNHAHLLFRSGPGGLPSIMRRLLSALRVQVAVHLVTHLGLSLAEAALHLGVSGSGIAKAVARTESK